MKIVFMGTPDFAVPSLDILVKNGYEVVGVVTMPDKWGGRGGKQLIESPIKKYALEHGLRLLQPEKLRNPDFQAELCSLNADLQIVVAFRMLPETVWAMPRLGTMNLHGSLLPKYRGAAPINWAIINGEKETGVTTFFLQHQIDTGDLLFTDTLAIGEDDTVGEVHDKMMLLGANLVLKSVQTIEKGNYQPQPQAEMEATHAPKIFTETCEINFNQSTENVHNFVRGLSPYPTAWTHFKGQKVKIYRTQKEIITPEHPIGEWVNEGKNCLKIACVDGYVHLLELQLEAKKRMLVKDFLNGFSLK